MEDYVKAQEQKKAGENGLTTEAKIFASENSAV
jgi:hypothetical protein